jgi:hypothetical protein
MQKNNLRMPGRIAEHIRINIKSRSQATVEIEANVVHLISRKRTQRMVFMPG